MAYDSQDHMPPWLRTRVPFVVLALGTIALGLWLHWHAPAIGSATRDVLGDACWAMMIAWWVGAAAPARGLGARSGTALAICVVVEVSQIVHTPALDALRETAGGQLVLGSGFDPRDLAAYVLGVFAAAVLERAVRPRRQEPNRVSPDAVIKQDDR